VITPVVIAMITAIPLVIGAKSNVLIRKTKNPVMTNPIVTEVFPTVLTGWIVRIGCTRIPSLLSYRVDVLGDIIVFVV
jgi:hypothetical protein